METLATLALITPTEFVLGIAATVLSALLIGVGTLLWRQTGEIHKLQLTVELLAKDVEKLKRLMEQGRKWRWDKTPIPAPDDDY